MQYSEAVTESFQADRTDVFSSRLRQAGHHVNGTGPIAYGLASLCSSVNIGLAVGTAGAELLGILGLFCCAYAALRCRSQITAARRGARGTM